MSDVTNLSYASTTSRKVSAELSGMREMRARDHTDLLCGAHQGNMPFPLIALPPPVPEMRASCSRQEQQDS